MFPAELEETQKFLSALFGDAEQQECFQIFANAEDSTIQARYRYRFLRKAFSGLEKNNLAGAGIYVMVNRGDGKGRKKESVTEVRAFFVDLDGAPLDPVLACAIRPHVVTQTSKDRYQAFWRTECPLESFEQVQRALAKRFNADSACVDLNRVMRLPGFWNMKREPFFVKVLQAENGMTAVPWTSFVERLQLKLEASTSHYNPITFKDDEIFTKGTRHQNMKYVLARLRHAGLSGGRLLKAAMEENTARCDPPLPDKEIHNLLRWVEKNVDPRDISKTRLPRKEHKEVQQPQGILSLAALDLKRFPPVNWIIRDLLPAGLTVLAGRPKVGKSWFGQNLCIAVACGEEALGKFAVNKGRTLSLALEDPPQRFQYRMRVMLGEKAAPDSAFFCNEWPRMPAGTDFLENWLKEHQEHARLIVVDTLAKFRSKGGRFEAGYERDYADIADLQVLARDYGVAIILIHHERKGASEDDYDRVSGTAGITGAADTVWILERKDRTKMRGTLIISGRDISDRQYALEWHEATGTWLYAGTGEEERNRSFENDILEAFRFLEKPAGAKEIADVIGKQRTNVQTYITKMVAKKILEPSVRQGKYVISPEPAKPVLDEI